MGILLSGGDDLATMQPGAFWAKITGNAASTNRYSWEQIDDGDTAAFDVGLADGFAASGSTAATGACAYEVNGRTDVATGTRVLLYPMGDLTYYGFAAPSAADSITVEEVDGSPSYTGITTLRFDQADGFTVTNPSTGVARVDFSGVIGSGVSGRVAYWNGTNSITSTSGFEFDGTNLFVPGEVVAAGIGGFSGLYLDLGSGNTTADSLGRVYASTQVTTPLVRALDSNWGYLITANAAGSTDDDKRYIQIQNGGGPVGLSQSGALGPGATAMGGIITDLGSGSFGDVTAAGNNTFSGTNSFSNTTTFTGTVASQNAATFTPTTAATVPTTIQGAASQSADLLQLKNSGGTLLGGFDANGVGEFSMDFGTF